MAASGFHNLKLVKSGDAETAGQIPRKVQVVYSVLLDDVERKSLANAAAIIRQMARDMAAIRRSRIRYDRMALFDCGWTRDQIGAYSRAAAARAEEMRDEGGE